MICASGTEEVKYSINHPSQICREYLANEFPCKHRIMNEIRNLLR